MHKENKGSKLSKGRSIQCPTCGAMKGNDCLVLAGPRKGRTMPTVIHTARLKTVGLPPQHGHKLARPKQQAKVKVEHSAAGRKAWRTRRRNLREAEQKAKLDAFFLQAKVPMEQLGLKKNGPVHLSFMGIGLTCDTIEEAAELAKKLSN